MVRRIRTTFIEDRFLTFQDKMLDYVTKPKGRRKISYLDEWEEKDKLTSFSVKGKLKFLHRKPARNRSRRRERAIFYGYYGHEIPIVEEAEYNLGSTALWRKARTVRWLKVYEECIGEGWDIRKLSQWQKAAAVIANQEGVRSIWDILEDTQR